MVIRFGGLIMEKEIVYTDKYALILSDEEIKEGDYYLLIPENKVKRANNVLSLNRDWKKVIGYLNLNDAPILEGVPLLPSFRWGQQDDVNKLAYEQWKKPDYRSGNPPYIYGIGFYEGYNKAKEKYNLTLSRLVDLYIEESGYGMDMWGKEENETMTIISKIIQSLQQPSRPTHFEFENVYRVKSGTIQEHKEGKAGYEYYELKTTTNLQGHIELVGKYLNL